MLNSHQSNKPSDDLSVHAICSSSGVETTIVSKFVFLRREIDGHVSFTRPLFVFFNDSLQGVKIQPTEKC